MRIIIDNADQNDFNELAKLARAGKINTFCMTDDERPQGECKSCRHRDPEDKKCDCGEQERQGCPFPVSDDYFCKFYEKGGAE